MVVEVVMGVVALEVAILVVAGGVRVVAVELVVVVVVEVAIVVVASVVSVVLEVVFPEDDQCKSNGDIFLHGPDLMGHLYILV